MTHELREYLVISGIGWGIFAAFSYATGMIGSPPFALGVAVAKLGTALLYQARLQEIQK